MIFLSINRCIFKSSTEEGLAAQAEFKALNADVMVVAAYGLILPQVVLDTPKYGCLNIHGSLLPAGGVQRLFNAQFLLEIPKLGSPL